MLPVRGATLSRLPCLPRQAISIHAPRAGSDQGSMESEMFREDFNPCSPCGERHSTSSSPGIPRRFQSMLPVRGATLGGQAALPGEQISIHAPRAGSDQPGPFYPRRPEISIHAPRAGSDKVPFSAEAGNHPFQSMLPVRGATPQGPLGRLHRRDFNPCSPCGERRLLIYKRGDEPQFQSMLPVRGATLQRILERQLRDISIHAPRAGSDHMQLSSSAASVVFQSMLPVRGATQPSGNSRCCITFQSMLPVRGATR